MEARSSWEVGNEVEQVARLLRARCRPRDAPRDARRPLLDARVSNAEKTLGRLRFTLDLTFDRGDGDAGMRVVMPWRLVIE